MKNKTILGICSAAAVLACVTANASPSSAIRYSLDGSSWTTVAIDEGAGDTFTGAGHVGIIHVEINAGGFTLDVVASKTYPAVGTLAHPEMDLAVSGVSGVGTLYIEFSANGFNPVPSGSFVTSIAPNNGAGVSESEITRVSSSPDDSLFGAGTSFGQIGPINGLGSASGSGSSPTLGSPYSITLQDKITSTAAGKRVSEDISLNVPDGGNTLMLLGSALSVLGFGFFRTRKAVKA